MTTNNAVNVGLSGATGTGNFVGATSPTLVTPTLGAASATSLTFSSTSGIIGTTTNDSAAAGSVGELISSVIASGSATTLTASTNINVTSISVTAGDWEIYGNVNLAAAGAGITQMYVWTSATSATLPDPSLYNSTQTAGGILVNTGMNAPTLRYSLSTTTTIYLGCFVNGGAGSTGCGGIYARRLR